jgi:hypothetical protein
MSKQYSYRYYIPDHGQTVEDAYEFRSNFDQEFAEFLAEDAAENYHDAHDGWEASWPLEIVVVGIGRFSVDREAVPQFRARTIASPSTTGQK